MSDGKAAGQAPAETEPAEAAPAEPKRLPDIVYQLYFGQFQQLSWLAAALAGGALVMYQVGLFKARPWNGIIAAILFGLAALVAVIGPLELTNGAIEGRDVRKGMKRYVVIALLLLGAGLGAVATGLVRTALAG